MTRAVAANPESADALAWQAYADIAAGTRLEEARDATRRAVALAPNEQSYRLQLADIEAAEAERRPPAVHAPPSAMSASGNGGPARTTPRAAYTRNRFGRCRRGRGAFSATSYPSSAETKASGFRYASGRALSLRRPSGCWTSSSHPSTAHRKLTLGCGARTPPDRCILTSKAGQAVAVEFLPRDYVP